MIEDRIAEAHELYAQAVTEATKDGHKLVATVVLFSGGNDSTTVAHLFKDIATHAAHANTSIGIEQTRQYVRDTCKAWNLPLLEKFCEPGMTYRDLVLGDSYAKSGATKGKRLWLGFPGPGGHMIMYNKLKERALDAMKRDLISNPRKERLIFITGVRQTESKRRANRAPMARRGSSVFVNPITRWTKLDLNAYRRKFSDVPRNEVADLLHMSGECLCGAFAHAGELDEIAMWFPEVAAEIRELEAEAAARGIERCRWGWGAGKEKPSESGLMCSSCDARFIPTADAA
jgi:3'-phosphoadenosine 5'-phosphosulfate sulfotransferase (PAPS reductase)/FAD synthetase